MTGFGDADPEDAYDQADPPDVKIAMLARMLQSVAAETAGPHDHLRAVIRIAFALRVIGELRRLHDPHHTIVLTSLLVGFSILDADEGP